MASATPNTFITDKSTANVSAQAESEAQAQWITAADCKNTENTWLSFQKVEVLDAKPEKALARIAADSKYWLWINGKMVVFEGCVKRGPNPRDTYYDDVDLAPYLQQGRNVISVLVWYFGKEGFSYKMSGQAGLFIDCTVDGGKKIVTDGTWSARVNPAYYTSADRNPNERLPESNVAFDARRDTKGWEAKEQKNWAKAIEKGTEGCAPWNNLKPRVIPMWKDYGLKEYVSTEVRKGVTHDTLVCRLPYDAQVTPWLQVQANAGDTIKMETDNFVVANDNCIRAEYVARSGMQEYESLGWISGNEMYYIYPKTVKIKKVQYRETGYDAEFAGSFSSNDAFMNRFWEKAVRTLYVNMRDTYFDCPDRERAQWWGDEVYLGSQTFYTLDPRGHLMMKKGMHELIGWQRKDYTLYAPIPCGNWYNELPGQSLSAVGHYGFWNYYMNTGDLESIRVLYPGVDKYLAIWKKMPDGTIEVRQGGWFWGDWGDNIDKGGMFNALYYLALKGQHSMALALGKNAEAAAIAKRMADLKEAFNRVMWTGKGYRHPDFKEETDDRVQALAVVSGLADADKYPAIIEILNTTEHASPCMEKYVIEAYFKMGLPEVGLKRMRRRYNMMVNDNSFTTLYEYWQPAGGTTNHAWSGCCIPVLAGMVCGVEPAAPGYERWRVAPCPADITEATTTVPTIKGNITASYKVTAEGMTLTVDAPNGLKGEVVIPKGYQNEGYVFTDEGSGEWFFKKK